MAGNTLEINLAELRATVKAHPALHFGANDPVASLLFLIDRYIKNCPDMCKNDKSDKVFECKRCSTLHAMATNFREAQTVAYDRK